VGHGGGGGGRSFACSQRFSDSVEGATGGGWGEDTVKTNVGKKGEHRERCFFREARAVPSLAT
jgi:hypothetical protein